MKKIILRKPKFMRADSVMKTYIDVANSISKVLDRPDVTSSERVELLIKIGHCINEAAKAGGFFSTKDFLNWIERQNHS